jgi:putative Mg2+ transporter-C (MgtC) family protein
VVRWIEARTKTTVDVETYYRVRVECVDGVAAHIRGILMRHIGGHSRLNVQGIATEDGEKEARVIVADVYALERNDRALEDIVARLSIEPEVTGVSWQRTAG